VQKDKYPYSLLIVEDNPGDQFLIEDYLHEQILDPDIQVAKTFTDAKKIIVENKSSLDAILIDLTLPDIERKTLLEEMHKLANGVPYLILTGYTDSSFAIEALKSGAEDYLIKDEINAPYLFKSILYAIERNNQGKKLEKSRKQYQDLFQLSPQPMWLCDAENGNIMDVNKAAISKYHYSYDEFLTLNLNDIYCDCEASEICSEESDNDLAKLKYVVNHKKKNGEILQAEVLRNPYLLNGKLTYIELINDVTELNEHIQTIKLQNQKLRDIAWTQSHVIRAPLARILGITQLINEDLYSEDEIPTFLSHITESAQELDKIVENIIQDAQTIMPEREQYKNEDET